ncbi:MAG: molybdopterin molybdotransferase MoeA [Candidatus Eremiobacteraeota bacterium]|nr:molybdopterin molybdotransferase MoeA [Candidatus Eremiobacteraeota bacterium]
MQDSAALLSSPFAGGDRNGGFAVERLLAPEQAVVAYFARFVPQPCGVENVTLAAAPGRILAEGASAREDHPSHARSTMDGYAVASDEGANGRRIVGTIRMGQAPLQPLRAGEAMRIPTGGAVPPGADAVVPQEDAALEGDRVVPHEPPRAGDYITRPAEDIARGECVLAAGRRLGGPELGVLATLGYAEVPVFRRPRIAVVSTGDELIDPRHTPAPGQIRDSNRYAIGAALTALGAEPVHLPRVADDRDAVRARLREALAECDALVTTGGSSVGAGDLVPEIVREFGEPGAIVHGLRVKPGKPTLLGAVGRKPVIALPGNPVSALMILEAVARPLVAALTGERAAGPVTLDAVAGEAFAGRAGWTWFVPVRLRRSEGRLEAFPLELRSAQTSLLARASGYATLGEQFRRVAPGERIGVTPFSCGGAPIANA